jgi:hypothetical protein
MMRLFRLRLVLLRLRLNFLLHNRLFRVQFFPDLSLPE